jgi:phosphopantothenoylcysteine synthetase/decarboxylase
MLAVVTTGPASTPIDEVRCMTNSATGEIGALLAEALAARGFQTLLFRARRATHTHVPSGALLHEFTTNHDLARALEALAETRAAEVRAVFHAAALSDYDLTAVRGPDGSLLSSPKIPGNLVKLHLLLEPAAKILPFLRAWFPRAWIVGWKYELVGTREEAATEARTPLKLSQSDATVLNGAAYGPGFGLLEGTHPPFHHPTKRELAQILASRAEAFAKSHK